MDLPLETICASYIIVWPSFREIKAGSKSLAIDLAICCLQRQLSMGKCLESNIFLIYIWEKNLNITCSLWAG